jgi:hypothetical protein
MDNLKQMTSFTTTKDTTVLKPELEKFYDKKFAHLMQAIKYRDESTQLFLAHQQITMDIIDKIMDPHLRSERMERQLQVVDNYTECYKELVPNFFKCLHNDRRLMDQVSDMNAVTARIIKDESQRVSIYDVTPCNSRSSSIDKSSSSNKVYKHK